MQEALAKFAKESMALWYFLQCIMGEEQLEAGLKFLCLSFCLGRDSAGGVGSSYVRTYVVRIVRNAQCACASNGMEAENSITVTIIYTSVKVFAAIYLPGP